MSNQLKDTSIQYEVMLGPNTNQWWVYDSINDTYIDPPVSVLEELKRVRKEANGDIEAQEKCLEDIVSKKPGWLTEKDFWYNDVEI